MLDHAQAMIRGESAQSTGNPREILVIRDTIEFLPLVGRLGNESSGVFAGSGCIGPQSAQPETLDLYLKGCPREIAEWEAHFIHVCPDDKFKAHDDVRVMPHVMLRTYLEVKKLEIRSWKLKVKKLFNFDHFSWATEILIFVMLRHD